MLTGEQIEKIAAVARECGLGIRLEGTQVVLECGRIHAVVEPAPVTVGRELGVFRVDGNEVPGVESFEVKASFGNFTVVNLGVRAW